MKHFMQEFPMPLRGRLCALSLLLAGCRGSSELKSYTLAEMRAPHDKIDNVARGPDTVVLISFFTYSGDTRTITRAVTMRNGKTSAVVLSKNFGQIGILPAGSVLGPAIPTPAYSVLRILPPSESLKNATDTFLVSWEDAGTWNTRVYDRTKLPTEVQDLCKQMKIPSTWL